MDPLSLVLLILGGLILLQFVAWGVAYFLAFYNNEKKTADPYEPIHGPQYDVYRPQLLELLKEGNSVPYEDVWILSKEGKKLHGRYYKFNEDETTPIQLMFHGYKDICIRDMSGGLLNCRERKQNVLMVDQRGHGLSFGRTIAFGVKERYDVLTWMAYLQGRFGKDIPIFLSGISMGAATVLMALSLPIEANLRGVIADCPYSEVKDILLTVASNQGYPKGLAYFLLKPAALIYGHFNIDATSAKKAVKNVHVPILLIHGDDDRFVPCRMSQEIQKENPEDIQLELFPGAAHGLSYQVDKPRYLKLINEFMDRCL